MTFRYSLEDSDGYTRHNFDAAISPRDLAETYYPPFAACVAAKPEQVMCSYNAGACTPDDSAGPCISPRGSRAPPACPSDSKRPVILAEQFSSTCEARFGMLRGAAESSPVPPNGTAAPHVPNQRRTLAFG